MSIISRPHAFGTDTCLVCNKKLKEKRKWYLCCTTRCQNKLADSMHKIIDSTIIAVNEKLAEAK